jgi:nickel transport protein
MINRGFFTLLYIVTILGGLSVSPAWAHKVNVFAYIEGETVKGEAYFSDGAPVKNSAVQVRDNEGKVLAESVTDGDGQFVLPLPRSLKTFSVVVSGGAGHQGKMELTRSEEGMSPRQEKEMEEGRHMETGKNGDVDVRDLEQTLRRIVREETEPLKRLLSETNKQLSKPGLVEVIGGIGYIVGLVGIALWAGNRKMKRH